MYATGDWASVILRDSVQYCTCGTLGAAHKAFWSLFLGRRSHLRGGFSDDAIAYHPSPQPPGELSSAVRAVTEMLSETAMCATELGKEAALRVAVSDVAGRINQTGGASLEVGTVVHDDSLHQLSAFWALDLLLIEQCLLQLLGTLGAVAQVFSGTWASYSILKENRVLTCCHGELSMWDPLCTSRTVAHDQRRGL